MKRLPLLHSLGGVASLGAIAALLACGGISDPTKGSSGERVATVSGALTGTSMPSNTRVALVWKVGTTGTYAVGSDVPVVDGKFTMALAAPPDSYLLAAEDDYEGLSSGGSAPVVEAPPEATDEAPSPPPSESGSTSSSGGGGQSFAFSNGLSPRDTVSGQINQPLSVAVAGFVVYVDTNGNGKLDIEGQWAKPIDDVIGGNKELFLAYLRDGGALDYEKLRDRSGILPHAGYNLAWDEGRWLPLDVVELKISANAKLPTAVCSPSGPSYVDEVPAATPSSGSGWGPNGYPDPNDPNLHCSPDGMSWSYTWPCETPEPEPVPVGLCGASGVILKPTPSCGGSSRGGGSGIVPGEPIPEGWPCPVPSEDGGAPIDGGSAPDAGM